MQMKEIIGEFVKLVVDHALGVVIALLASFVAVVLTRISGSGAIYQQPKQEGVRDFEQSGSQSFTKDGPVGQPGEGSATVLEGGVIEITRYNTEGRWILKFNRLKQPDGQYLEYIEPLPSADSQRRFRVSFQAKAAGGPHQLRIAFRKNTHSPDNFLKDTYFTVQASERWQPFTTFLSVAADAQACFFLESSRQETLSKVKVRELTLEEDSGTSLLGQLAKSVTASLNKS